MTTVKLDWRFVKVDQTRHVDAAFREKHGVKACGVIYLIDVNAYFYICSTTPALEAWPIQAFVEWDDFEELSEEQQDFELEMINSEESCRYFDLDVLTNPSTSAEKHVPEQEDGETFYAYRMRVGDEMREKFAGDLVYFPPEAT